MTLTCSSKDSHVTGYQFFNNNHLVSGNSKSNTFSVATVTFTHTGSYTCKALIDTVASDTSSAVSVKGKLAFIRVIFFLVSHLLILGKKDQG